MNFSRKAAGEDLVVDTTDISDLANSDSTYVEKVFNKIETGSLVGSDDWNHEEMMNLMGLKKFLEEFTLIEERGMVEVGIGGLASLLSTYGRSSYNSYCDAWFHNQRGKSLSSNSYSRSGGGGRSSRGGGRSFSGRGRGGGGLR